MKKFLLRVLNKLNLLGSVYLKANLHLNGRRFVIPVMAKTGFNQLFMTEPWMIDLLKKLRLDKGTFVDVGVNLGQTLLKLRSVYDSLNYVGFEPNPSCVNYVYELIRVNKIGNVSLLPVGLADRNGIFTLNFYYDNLIDSSASIIEDFRKDSPVKRKQYVAINTIESIRNAVDLSDVAMIKIDVEGAELEVIKSFREIFASQRPLLLMEILPVYSEANKDRLERQEAIETIFSELQYSWFRVVTNGSTITLNEIQSIGIHSDLSQCEYLVVPKEKQPEIAGAF